MGKAENLKKQIDALPSSMLPEIERFIKKLKKRASEKEMSTSLLVELTTYTIEDDLPTDLAEQHDHYLYGVPKK